MQFYSPRISVLFNTVMYTTLGLHQIYVLKKIQIKCFMFQFVINIFFIETLFGIRPLIFWFVREGFIQ